MEFDRQALARLRTLRGWTQADLAKAVGLSRPYINQIESGVREPSPHALSALAKVLDVQISSLLRTAECVAECPKCGHIFNTG